MFYLTQSMLVQAWDQRQPLPVILLGVAALQAALMLPHLSSAASTGLPNCPTSCGGVGVPYPFGIGAGCYHSAGFNLTCDGSHNPPRLFLGEGGTFQVLYISLANATVRAARTGGLNITFDGASLSNSSGDGHGTWQGLGDGGPYALLDGRNELLVLNGCNVLALLTAGGSGNSSNITISSCASFCPGTNSSRSTVIMTDSECTGAGCCKTPILIGRASYDIRFLRLNASQLPVWYETSEPPQVFITEEGWLEQEPAFTRSQGPYIHLDRTSVPVLLGWVIGSAPTGYLENMVFHKKSKDMCAIDAAHSACRSSHSSCRNVVTSVRSGYVCNCQEGYQGNPYLDDGCRDVNECERPEDYECFGKCTNLPGTFECRCPRGFHGNYYTRHGCIRSSSLGLSIGIGAGSAACLMLLVLIAIVVARKHKHRRANKLRKKFFQQNRGQLLQQLVGQRADITERMIISLEELEKATNSFDKARELGGGGHGTVYKGILSDLHVVAIKKSKITVQREIDEFINEVAILSQINHRNVVKLFGCCLETEVPLLVYEFVSNGTLYNHLHVTGPKSLSWDDRLRIAVEVAKAIAYLHSAVSVPVIHRDIKSSNILLDDTLTSKVADFGASRHIPVDRSEITTKVQGTIGYMDPMYYYTGRLTEKSDVYSFGVVLVELLTRKKPFSYLSPEDEGLVEHFVTLLTEDELVGILDPQVTEEGGEDVRQVAMLAATCIKLRGEDRPSMRQVEMALETIQASKGHASNNVATFEENNVGSYLASTQERPGNMHEVTRRYSLEEEFLMSARYPR